MIREMKREDYECIKKLVTETHEYHLKNRPDIFTEGTPLPVEYYNNMIDDENSLNYVYEEDGNVLGIIMVSEKIIRPLSILKKRKIYYVEDIAVAMDSRKKGIGESLIKYVEDVAKSKKADAIELNVWSFNNQAIDFYNTIGFKVKSMCMEKSLKRK